MTLYYFVLQYLHVIGATVLLGTGAGIAFSRFVFDYGATFDGEEATGVTQRVSLHVGL